MILNNEATYKRNYAKQWSICLTGAVMIHTTKVIGGCTFDNWPETKEVYIRKDYTTRRIAERWARYYDAKIKSLGKTYLRETHIHGNATEIWW